MVLKKQESRVPGVEGSSEMLKTFNSERHEEEIIQGERNENNH